MSNSGPLFDFASAFRESYQFIWRSRKSLLRASVWPFAVKLMLFFIVMILGLEDQFLRQGLIFVPSYFLEGWLIAYALRLAVYGERLQDLPKVDVLASAQIYTLIKLLSALVVGLAFPDPEAAQNPAFAGGSLMGLVLAVGALFFAIWSFRFMWLNVPVALGFSMQSYLKAIDGFAGSFRLIGLWFVISVPIFFITIFLYDVMAMLFPGGAEGEGSALYKMVFGAVQSILELVAAIVASAAIGHAFMQEIRRKKK